MIQFKLITSIQFQIFCASVKMAKYFEFTNNNSDVFVVGNSQLLGFKGLNKNKDCGMNISMCRGAKIEDCFAECQSRVCARLHLLSSHKYQSTSRHSEPPKKILLLFL